MKTAIELTSIVQRTSNLLSCNVDGEIVLLDVDIGNYLGLNATASYILELVETPQTVATLCQQIMKKYDVSQEQCQQELMTFLTELADKKIISIQQS